MHRKIQLLAEIPTHDFLLHQAFLPSGVPADRVRLRKALGVRDMEEIGEGRGAGSCLVGKTKAQEQTLGNALLGGQL